MSILIIVLFLLVLILIVLACIMAFVKSLSRKARSAARTLFGTETLREGFEQIEEEYATTPKSVSAVTSLYLPKIVRDFPEFNLEQMKTRAENVLVSYLRALDQSKMELPEDCSPEFKQQLELCIKENQSKQQRMQYKDIKVHRTEITGYRKIPGRCTITFQTALQSLNHGQMVQTKWNTDVIYTQDSEKTETKLDDGLGMNCPNCGAPITTLGNKVCEYCGTQVVELNIHVWLFNKVDEIN